MNASDVTQSVVESYDGYPIPFLVDYSATNTRAVVVITHGIFTDKREKGRFDRLSNRLNSSGYHTVRFDFRGHGESSLPFNRFNIADSILDLHAILRATKNQFSLPFFLVGSSFGGGIAILAISTLPPDSIRAISLLNPVLSYWDFAKGKNLFATQGSESFISQNRVVGDEHEFSTRLIVELGTLCPATALAIIGTPIILFHGSEDEKVSVSTSRRIAKKIDSIEYVEIAGAVHAFKDPLHERRVHEQTITFFDTWMR
jgi:uncharacterized protein